MAIYKNCTFFPAYPDLPLLLICHLVSGEIVYFPRNTEIECTLINKGLTRITHVETDTNQFYFSEAFINSCNEGIIEIQIRTRLKGNNEYENTYIGFVDFTSAIKTCQKCCKNFDLGIISDSSIIKECNIIEFNLDRSLNYNWIYYYNKPNINNCTIAPLSKFGYENEVKGSFVGNKAIIPILPTGSQAVGVLHILGYDPISKKSNIKYNYPLSIGNPPCIKCKEDLLTYDFNKGILPNDRTLLNGKLIPSYVFDDININYGQKFKKGIKCFLLKKNPLIKNFSKAEECCTCINIKYLDTIDIFNSGCDALLNIFKFSIINQSCLLYIANSSNKDYNLSLVQLDSTDGTCNGFEIRQLATIVIPKFATVFVPIQTANAGDLAIVDRDSNCKLFCLERCNKLVGDVNDLSYLKGGNYTIGEDKYVIIDNNTYNDVGINVDGEGTPYIIGRGSVASIYLGQTESRVIVTNTIDNSPLFYLTGEFVNVDNIPNANVVIDLTKSTIVSKYPAYSFIK